MVDSAPTGEAHPGRDLYRRLLGAMERSPDALSALQSMLAPDARVHVQNGDIVPPEQSMRHTAVARATMPNLTVAIEDVFFPPDAMVVQLLVEGTVSGGVPFLPAGYQLSSPACIVARPGPSGLFAELWSYVNPGFAFAFPRTGVSVPPPPPDGAGPEHARALYEEWIRRANEGTHFVGAVGATLSPDGVVRLGNGDVGGAHLLEDLFSRITRGLPDVSLELEQVMVADDRVVVQFTMMGTHLGPMGVWPPTGRLLPSTGAFIARANRAAQASELWVYVAPGYAITVPPSGS